MSFKLRANDIHEAIINVNSAQLERLNVIEPCEDMKDFVRA